MKLKGNKGHINNYWEKITRIQIVLYIFEDSSKYALFFHDKIISLLNIEDFSNIGELNINTNYNNFTIEQLQFLVCEKFLLIFYFYEQKCLWEYDSYSINLKKWKSIFETWKW